MGQVLVTILPVFGMAMIGYFAGRLRLLDQAAARGLVAFVFNLAIPVMLFRKISAFSMPEIEWRGMAAYYTATSLVYFGAVISGRRLLRLPVPESGAFGMAAAFSNTVLLGLPIVLKVHGERGVLPLLLIISCHTTFLFTLGTVFIETAQSQGQSWPNTLRKIAFGLATNPIIIGLVSGLLFNLSDLTLPGWIEEIAAMFGQAAVPCALFAMGLSLCRFKLGGSLSHTLQLAVWKLLLHPLLVFLFARYLFGLSPLWTSVTVIAAAMPSGINAFLFASGYRAEEATVGATVLLTTAAAMVTVSILLVLGI